MRCILDKVGLDEAHCLSFMPTGRFRERKAMKRKVAVKVGPNRYRWVEYNSFPLGSVLLFIILMMAVAALLFL